MDTKQLITFVTFAKEKSYTKSSLKLNYAISTLSDHISSLESELGVKLVENHGKRTLLSKNGELFLEYAHKMLMLYHEAQDAMAYLNNVQGTLHILTSESLGLYRVSPVFEKFTKMFPNVDLSVAISNPNSFFEKLESKEADLVFLFGLAPYSKTSFHSTIVFREDLVFIAHPKHPLAKKDAVLPSDFRSESFLLPQTDCFYRQALQDMLEEHGVCLKIRMHLDSGSLIKSYVKSGYGVSLLPFSVVKEEIEAGVLCQLKWQGTTLEAIAQVITLKKEWQNPTAQKLIDTTLEMFHQTNPDISNK